jgi:hypothetical protein
MDAESVCLYNYVPATIYAGGVTQNAPRKRWADLADLALVVGRELQYRGYSHDQALWVRESSNLIDAMEFLPDARPPAVGVDERPLGPAGSGSSPARTEDRLRVRRQSISVLATRKPS